MSLLSFLMIAGGMMLVLIAPAIERRGAIRRTFIGVSMALRRSYRPAMHEHPFEAMLIQIDERATSPARRPSRPWPEVGADGDANIPTDRRKRR